MRLLKLPVAAALILSAGTACDLSGDWLFDTAVEGVPGVIHLGELTPAAITTPASIERAILFGEVGPTGTAEVGGVTFTFEGTGGSVCVWVDPELAHWSQSVAAQRPNVTYSYPDNVRDDGDLDLYAGLAAYYNGSPGERVGDFRVRYTDSLGNPVTVALNECRISTMVSSAGGHSGRGAPEYCTLANTQPGVDYMVLMQTWSLPLDDSRLSYGLLLTEGSCSDLQALSPAQGDECVILGESIPAGAPGFPGPWVDGDVPEARPGSEDLERLLCAEGNVSGFCATEAEDNDCRDPNISCFCGDPSDTPSPGSF